MSDVLARARYWLDSIDGAVPLERAIDYDLMSDLSAEIVRLRAALDALAWDTVDNRICRFARDNNDPMTGECLACARIGRCPLFHIVDLLDLPWLVDEEALDE